MGSRSIDSLAQISGPLHAVLTNGDHSYPWLSYRFQSELRVFLDHYVKGLPNGYDKRDRIQVWWENQRPKFREDAPRWTSGFRRFLCRKPAARPSSCPKPAASVRNREPDRRTRNAYLGGTG